jgi:hypothetical protein
MSFTPAIVLTDAVGASKTFSLQYNDAGSARRIDVDSSAALPRYLTIKHETKGSGFDAVDRHLISLEETVMSGSVARKVVTNLTLQVPRDVVITPLMVSNQLAMIANFFGFDSADLAGTDKVLPILRGES